MKDTELTPSQLYTLGKLFSFPSKVISTDIAIDVMALMSKEYVHIVKEEFRCTTEGVCYLAQHQPNRQLKITPTQLKEIVDMAFDSGQLWKENMTGIAAILTQEDTQRMKEATLKAVINTLCAYWIK